ncbi:flagellar filament capping protein FliD [Marichromatium gracile]|uniref:Flagellar hook-associated protein 2 n=1 Tax=Marichromatium gracile TaxID=1048 RepID=A0ABR5VFP7_MARGR|nr:flagellar filament capping protein FliD [Marichromatium gracile]KXX64553.1 flagellar hook protein [Marichromatium gracile]
MADNIISSLGAGSGIDITSLVSQLVEVERAPVEQRISSREERLQAEISGYGKLSSALSELQDSLGSLAGNDLFNARSVAIPDTNVITANSVAVGAQTGSYQIEVEDIARAQSLTMGAQSERDSALGKSGELTIRFGEWTYDGSDAPSGFTANDEREALTVSIDASDSLDAIAAKINEQNSGVQASVLKVDDQYQLMLTAPSGAANALEISGDDASLDDFAFNAANHANVTEVQQGSDALLRINGLQVSRESNDIDDVIEGFNFTLNKASPGESLTFSISEDKSLAEQAVRDFVDAYNSFQETAQGLIGYARDDAGELVRDENGALSRGDLASDGTARAMVDRLRELVGGEVQGLEGGFTALTNLGIRTERDGSLSIAKDEFGKEAEFSAAFSNNFQLVEDLFALKTASMNSAVSVNLGSFAGRVDAGSFEVEITQDPSRGELLADAITQADFDAATETFTTALDTTGGGYSFKVEVNGIESGAITLNGTYDSADQLRSDLQSLINSDEALKATGTKVDVLYDDATDSFSFVSREYGSVSTVAFTEASASMADLGVHTGLTGTAGIDVAGTINGVEGFGAGNQLLPALDSPAYGLNFSVAAGASSQGAFDISFSRGFAGELSRLIDGFLSSSGTIEMRKENIQDQLTELGEERETLDRRMEGVEARLLSQFIAMESIVSTFQSTGSQLEGLVDRLPNTARN